MGARELLEVERVASRLFVERVRPLTHDARAEERVGCLARETTELEAGQASVTVGALERRRETFGRLARTLGQDQEDGSVGRPAQQRREQLHRRGIGPVDVVEHEHQRPAVGEPLQQLAHRPMGAIAFVLQRRSARRRQVGEGGQDEGQLAEHLVAQRPDKLRA